MAGKDEAIDVDQINEVFDETKRSLRRVSDSQRDLNERIIELLESQRRDILDGVTKGSWRRGIQPHVAWIGMGALFIAGMVCGYMLG
ncbi:hypothetical protein [Nitrosomonas marina]|uniref:Uncharacterized protein n=1 Tax=Nitrosomonas marina TaxID=917 RepID=A0A1H8GKB3_9PROT|nr:hypothetical protein [Nitrosomonas marina]SEN43927.1 hypothetical protein SAMN05216325_11849 [Nitrosomonas marina]